MINKHELDKNVQNSYKKIDYSNIIWGNILNFKTLTSDHLCTKVKGQGYLIIQYWFSEHKFCKIQ